MAYLTGELLNYDPWTRIQGPARCESVYATPAEDSNTARDVDCRPQYSTHDGRYKKTPMVHDVSRPQQHRLTCSQSQLRREQIPEALTQGMRSKGMMAVVDPTFKDPANQAYAAQWVEQTSIVAETRHSQRMMTESQVGSQFNKQEHHFMRMTGNLVSARILLLLTTDTRW